MTEEMVVETAPEHQDGRMGTEKLQSIMTEEVVAWTALCRAA